MNEAWCEREYGEYEPAAWRECRQQKVRMVHRVAARDVGVERLVLVEVPLLHGLLRQACPMSDHGFEQLVGQREPFACPGLSAAVVDPRQNTDTGNPYRKKQCRSHSREGTENQQSQRQLEDREQRKHRPTEAERVDDAGFHHEAEQLSSTLALDRLSIGHEGASQESPSKPYADGYCR